jgi:hypothetical protein
MSGVTASLTSGKSLTSTVTIAITNPSGKKKTISKGDSYTFTEAGDYTLVYTVKNPDASGANKKTTATRTVTVPEQQTDDTQPDDGETAAGDGADQPEATVNE